MIQKKYLLTAVFAACLSAPFAASAGNFDAAVKQAETEIDQAKSKNYEWRDSRKILKKAQALYQKGDKDKAMKLVQKAASQGRLAVAQAEAQSGVKGPHQ